MSESVWDYPRPPRVEPLLHIARVQFDGITIARSGSALRVLETSHPPTIYFPPADVRLELLKPAKRATWCEWKGQASYFDIAAEHQTSSLAAWSYAEPALAYRALKDHVAFYPGRVDACFIDDERVTAQPGDFYGGWITVDIVGPFKGAAWTAGW
ncbi:MAG: DUF427 domain-containing protein [Candidatus Dormibacteraceae bacterium]